MDIAVPSRDVRPAGTANRTYWKSATLSFVTISVPVSMFGSTSLPLAASNAACTPRLPILAGNWATEAVSVPADDRRDLVRSRVESDRDQLSRPADLIASSAPISGGPHAA